MDKNLEFLVFDSSRFPVPLWNQFCAPYVNFNLKCEKPLYIEFKRNSYLDWANKMEPKGFFPMYVYDN